IPALSASSTLSLHDALPICIKDHERVLFDGGSTVGALAATLGKRESLRVTAMGVNAINSLIDRDDIELSSPGGIIRPSSQSFVRSEEHTSELQSRFELVCRL